MARSRSTAQANNGPNARSTECNIYFVGSDFSRRHHSPHCQTLIEIEAALEEGDVEEVYVFHNHPEFGAVYDPVSKRLLPLDHAWQNKLAAMAWPTKNLPEVIEGAKSALPA